MAFAIPALAIGSSVLGAATSFAAARQQNAAIQQSMASQAQAANIQQRQLAEQAGLERLRNERQAAQVLGRIRASSGEAGISLNSGTVRALENQAAADMGLNDQVIRSNFSNQVQLVRSGAQANLASLASRQQNPLLSGFSGAAGGLQTGLSIGTGISEVGRFFNTPQPQPVGNIAPPRLFS